MLQADVSTAIIHHAKAKKKYAKAKKIFALAYPSYHIFIFIIYSTFDTKIDY